MARFSVPEVAFTGKHHRHAVGIRCGDHLIVTYRPSRLDHCRGAGLGGCLPQPERLN
jgi:hypothetical protein